ncbi:hypothetical protein AB0I81_22680 [Nonomuraea sp. NPDC050404]|uniref:hypothetical protein n=1 Tax=Nonomuraea sp. NPDC050404 TaxID=3155783 RepID=UPI0033F31CD8
MSERMRAAEEAVEKALQRHLLNGNDTLLASAAVKAAAPILMADVDALAARILDLHRGPRTERHGSCCADCGRVWPCPSRQALDGHEYPGQVTVRRADLRRIVEVAAAYLDMCEPPPADDLATLERLRLAAGGDDA